MPRLSAARVKLPISATVMKMRTGSRFCIFAPWIVHSRRNSEFASAPFIISERHSRQSASNKATPRRTQMSEAMNLRQPPQAMTLHPSLWAGRIMSAIVVIALAADGAIQLFAPAQIASTLQETGFAMEATRVVGPIILVCAILYAIPATAILGAILVTGFLGGAICAHVRIRSEE